MKGICINKFFVCMLTVLVAASLSCIPSQAVAEGSVADEQALLGLYYDEDALFETATGTPKPISQVAENVTIITRQEIDALHAHNVGDVLQYVSGLYLDGNFEPINSSFPVIDGSDFEHALVLVDGIRVGYRFEDFPETVAIPVRVVKRIEVIKGPASSTWGSALGGVINIITKDVGASYRPQGEVFATYGEHNTYDTSAQVNGGFGKVGYYMQAGSQQTDGITRDREADDGNVYAKIGLSLPQNAQLTLILNYAEPEYTLWANPARFEKNVKDTRTVYYTGILDVPHITEKLSSSFSLYRYKHKDHDSLYSLVTRFKIADDRTYDTCTEGFTGRFILNQAKQTAVLGFEFERSDIDVSIDDYDFPSASTGPVDNHDENWAVYLNDTIRWGRFTFVPGLRYDHLDLSDNVLSPSLGFTYKVTDQSLLRGTVSTGFRKPTVGLSQYNAFDVWYGIQISNPKLESIDVQSVQLGIETMAFRWGQFKTSMFVHKLDKVWIFDDALLMWVNDGGETFRGAEAEIRTVPWQKLSMMANATFVRKDSDIAPSGNLWLANVMLRYDDPQLFTALFLGKYVDYGPLAHEDYGSNDDMIWDLQLAKKMPFRDTHSVELFGIGHNLFAGRQEGNSHQPYVARWFEAGVRLLF